MQLTRVPIQSSTESNSKVDGLKKNTINLLKVSNFMAKIGRGSRNILDPAPVLRFEVTPKNTSIDYRNNINQFR